MTQASLTRAAEAPDVSGVGDSDGVSLAVTLGLLLGCVLGIPLGNEDGVAEGRLLSVTVGELDGAVLGLLEGAVEGAPVVGEKLGKSVGVLVGVFVGVLVGNSVGKTEGRRVGTLVVGGSVGFVEGAEREGSNLPYIAMVQCRNRSRPRDSRSVPPPQMQQASDTLRPWSLVTLSKNEYCRWMVLPSLPPPTLGTTTPPDPAYNEFVGPQISNCSRYLQSICQFFKKRK